MRVHAANSDTESNIHVVAAHIESGSLAANADAGAWAQQVTSAPLSAVVPKTQWSLMALVGRGGGEEQSRYTAPSFQRNC
jgi:hypothetical protein